MSGLRRGLSERPRTGLAARINPMLLESSPPGITKSRRREKSESEAKNSAANSPNLVRFIETLFLNRNLFLNDSF